MAFSFDERRTLLNLWCRVARADGVVDDAELDRLSQLFYGFAESAVSADEIKEWIEDGPPVPGILLPREAEPLFLEQAREIMAPDGELIPAKAALVRELLNTYFAR